MGIWAEVTGAAFPDVLWGRPLVPGNKRCWQCLPRESSLPAVGSVYRFTTPFWLILELWLCGFQAFCSCLTPTWWKPGHNVVAEQDRPQSGWASDIRGVWLGYCKGAQSAAAARQPVNGCRKQDIVTYRGLSRLKAAPFYGLTPPMTPPTATPSVRISHRGQPPLTLDLSQPEPAGSGALHRCLRLFLSHLT